MSARDSLGTRIGATFGLVGFVLAALLLFRVTFAVLDAGRDSGNTIVIGSKQDTEGVLLAEIMAQLIEQRTDLRVVRRSNLGGTFVCFAALRAGEIDLYPEYTGTGLVGILKQPPTTDGDSALRTVKREFSERWGLVWLEPMAFNNTYALALTRAQATRLDVRAISDLRRHPGLSAGFTAEFLARPDGYPGLRQRYGIDLDTKSMEAGLMYGAAAAGEVRVIGAYATDGRIAKYDLRLLDDDRGFFPPYRAAPLLRRETLDEHPELVRALAPLAGRISDADMQRLNAAVDIDKRDPAEVARQWVAALDE